MHTPQDVKVILYCFLLLSTTTTLLTFSHVFTYFIIAAFDYNGNTIYKRLRYLLASIIVYTLKSRPPYGHHLCTFFLCQPFIIHEANAFVFLNGHHNMRQAPLTFWAKPFKFWKFTNYFAFSWTCQRYASDSIIYAFNKLDACSYFSSDSTNNAL